MKKKLIIILSMLIVVVGGGLWYGKSLIEKKVSDYLLKNIASEEVVNQLQDKKMHEDVLKKLNDLKAKDGPLVDNSQTTDPNISSFHGTNKNISKDMQPSYDNRIHATKNIKTSDNDTINPTKTTKLNSNTNVSKNTEANQTQKIKTREEVIHLVKSRLSTSDILRFLQMYENRKSMTKEQKQEAKAELVSHFTSEEIEMMLQAVGKN